MERPETNRMPPPELATPGAAGRKAKTKNTLSIEGFGRDVKPMNEWYERARSRLEAEKQSGKYDRYANAMKNAVYEALDGFCRQDAEFAQAVVQGGTFTECMKAVAKGCGNAISDLEAFRRAVRFYFPGADVRFHMTVNLCADVERDDDVDTELVDDVNSWAARHAADPAPKILNLEDFL